MKQSSILRKELCQFSCFIVELSNILNLIYKNKIYTILFYLCVVQIYHLIQRNHQKTFNPINIRFVFIELLTQHPWYQNKLFIEHFSLSFIIRTVNVNINHPFCSVFMLFFIILSRNKLLILRQTIQQSLSIIICKDFYLSIYFHFSFLIKNTQHYEWLILILAV